MRGEICHNGRWEKDADNFGKLDRFYDDGLRQFRDDVWSLVEAGKTLKDWKTFVTKGPVTQAPDKPKQTKKKRSKKKKTTK